MIQISWWDGGSTTSNWWMKIIQEKEGMNSKQKWRMTLQRSQVQRLKWLSENEEWGNLLDRTTRSVEEFGKNWSGFSEGSIGQDHRWGKEPRAMAKKNIPSGSPRINETTWTAETPNVSQHEAIKRDPWEWIEKHRDRAQLKNCLDSLNGKSTPDAIVARRQLQERYRQGQQDLHSVLIDLKKNPIQHSPEGRTVRVGPIGA